jgi:hypothetical protein
LSKTAGESLSQTAGESMSQTARRVPPVQKKKQPRNETADRQRKQLTGKETNDKITRSVVE